MFINKYKSQLKYLFLTLYIIFLFIFRYFWALTPSWMVDSSTTLFLSEILEFYELKVGLLSSKYIPQPNGMLIFSYLLNRIGNLVYISFFLSVMQLYLLFLMISQLDLNFKKRFYLFTIIASSIVVSNFSVHFYNQWFVINITFLFFYLYLKFYNTKNIKYFSSLFIVLAIPPTIYLASIVSSIFMFVSVAILGYRNRKVIISQFKKSKYFLFLIATVYLLIIMKVWVPYFSNVDLTLFDEISVSINTRLKLLYSNILLILPFLISVFSEEKSLYIRFLEPALITDNLQLVKVFFLETQKTIINLLIIVLLISVKNKYFKCFQNSNLLIFISYILFFTIFTPFFGGNNFLQLDRMDQYLEVYPFFLIIIYLIFNNFAYPENFQFSQGIKSYFKNFILFIGLTTIIYFSTRYINLSNRYFVLSKINLLSISTYFYFLFGVVFIFFENIYFKYFNYIKTVIFLTFLITNITFSILSIKERLYPPYTDLTEAEVSIFTKYQLIDSLLLEIENQNIKNPKISYQLGGNKFEWINEHGEKFSYWYPLNPYTLGRPFDFILLKEHNLVNFYEGELIRNIEGADFIISFTKDDLEVEEKSIYKNYIFNQLRLSVREVKK